MDVPGGRGSLADLDRSRGALSIVHACRPRLHLYAPLAAMGDIAVGERRGGFDRPARSAVLGLVAAALGIDRADEEGHAALDRGYRMAQRVRARGTLVEDYHTVQAPPRTARRAGRRGGTRWRRRSSKPCSPTANIVPTRWSTSC